MRYEVDLRHGVQGASVRTTPVRSKKPKKSSHLAVAGFFVGVSRVEAQDFAGLFSSSHSPQNCQGRPASVGDRNPVSFIDQFAQLGGRVVTGDVAVLVAQQSFPVFLCYLNCPKSSAEGVLQIVNAD